MNDYISREAAVDVGYLSDWYIASVGDEPPVWTDAHIDELLNDFIVIPKDTKSADVQPVDRWIDAQKNPPPIVDRRSMTSESVLILIDNGRCAVAYYCYDDEDGNCWVTDDEKTMYDLEEVTRWQPLPEPPKDGDTE